MTNKVVTSGKVFVLTTALALGLTACGGDDGGGGDDGNIGPVTGECHYYVNDTLKIPTTSAQAQQFGLDLDGDPNSRPDNALGGVLALLAGQGADIQMQIDEAITGGSLIILSRLHADDLANDPSVIMQVYLGEEPATPPAFDGSDMFTVDPQGPSDARLPGNIVGGKYKGGPGTVRIEIPIVEGQPPLVLDLIGVKIETGVTATGMTGGKLGGAITKDAVENDVLPTLQNMVQATIDDDMLCTAPNCYDMTGAPMCEDTTNTILNLFDANKDCAVTLEEIKEDDIVKAVLTPDVDLLDAQGNYNPRSDGEKESLSLGVGFTAVNATFMASCPDPEQPPQ